MVSDSDFGFDDDDRVLMQIVELSENKRIEWLCTHSDPEWIGTRVSFELYERKNGITAIVLEHFDWRELTEFYLNTPGSLLAKIIIISKILSNFAILDCEDGADRQLEGCLVGCCPSGNEFDHDVLVTRRVSCHNAIADIGEELLQLTVLLDNLLVALFNDTMAQRRVFEFRTIDVHGGHFRPVVLIKVFEVFSDKPFIVGGSRCRCFLAGLFGLAGDSKNGKG